MCAFVKIVQTVRQTWDILFFILFLCHKSSALDLSATALLCDYARKKNSRILLEKQFHEWSSESGKLFYRSDGA